MVDHGETIPIRRAPEHCASDSGQPTENRSDPQRRPLRVVLPDEPALPPAAAAALLRILRTADRKSRQAPDQQQIAIEEKRRAA